jgi:hypothetical protein
VPRNSGLSAPNLPKDLNFPHKSHRERLKNLRNSIASSYTNIQNNDKNTRNSTPKKVKLPRAHQTFAFKSQIPFELFEALPNVHMKSFAFPFDETSTHKNNFHLLKLHLLLPLLMPRKIHVWMPANDEIVKRVNLNHLEHETENVDICIILLLPR